MSYALVHKQLGDDLWGTITGAFTGATSAAKTGASAAWGAAKSAADPQYKLDLEKQLKCQRGEPLEGLGQGAYYDTEKNVCVTGQPEQQKASCEASGGVWATSEVGQDESGDPVSIVWGCMTRDVYNAKVAAAKGRPRCRKKSWYDYTYATEICGAKNGPKHKDRCAKRQHGLAIWSPGRPPHEGFWDCVAPKSEAKAPAGIGAVTSSRPKTWLLPDDSPVMYPPVSLHEGNPATAESEGTTGGGGWWSDRTDTEKVAIVGGAAVLGIGVLWLVAR